MVTNAQFPDKIKECKDVTQLYISVDAPTKEALFKVDRPIFKDYWERLLQSIDEINKKGIRTVYRFTLIKEWNMEEIKQYAILIKRGKPKFVECKGVTYSGNSKDCITMKDVPYHEEVVKFSKSLVEQDEIKNDYEICVEHEHSLFVLIADKKFKVNGEW
jgi:tRNA wybutosine-synthesizing protein 1